MFLLIFKFKYLPYVLHGYYFPFISLAFNFAAGNYGLSDDSSDDDKDLDILEANIRGNRGLGDIYTKEEATREIDSPQDIYTAAYNVIEPIEEDDSELEDPYAAIDIDYKKVKKPKETKRQSIKDKESYELESSKYKNVSEFELDKGREESQNEELFDEKITSLQELKKLQGEIKKLDKYFIDMPHKQIEDNISRLEESSILKNKQENKELEASYEFERSTSKPINDKSKEESDHKPRQMYWADYKSPHQTKEETKCEVIDKKDEEVQTEMVIVQFSDKSTRECLLEATVIEEKKKNKLLQADTEEKEQSIRKLKEDIRKIELNYSTLQRETANSTETIKRLMAENKESIHQYNMLKIEKEDLVKRMEQLGNKVVQLEKDKEFIQSECDKRMKLGEEHVKSKKTELRELEEQRYNYRLERLTMEKELKDREEELVYYKEKCAKYESATLKMSINMDTETKIRELQQENYVLQLKLKEGRNYIEDNKESNKDIAHELEMQETLIKGYQKENENMLEEIKQLKNKLKDMQSLMCQENLKAREQHSKQIKDKNLIMIEDHNEIAIDTLNHLGKSGIIGVNELKTLRLQLEILQLDKKKLEEQLEQSNKQLKTEISMLLKQKEELEVRAGMKYEDIGREKQERKELERELERVKKKYEGEIEQLQGKIKWLTENQELIDKHVKVIQEKEEEISKLKKMVKEIADNRGLRKSMKLGDDSKEGSKLRKELNELKKQLKESELKHEAKIRSLQQQYEKVKLRYAAKPSTELLEERIKDLEQEKEYIKKYYTDKLKNIEDQTDNQYKSLRDKPLSRLLNKSEIMFLLRLLLELQKLRSMQEVEKIMDNVTQILNHIPECLKVTVTKLIDKIMVLGELLTAESKDEGKALVILGELEIALLSELDKMEGVNIKPKNNSTTLMIDVSDSDLEVEMSENEMCINAIKELKEWLPSSGLTVSKIKRKYDALNTGKVLPDNLVELLNELKYPLNIAVTYIWARRLETDIDGYVEYAEVLNNIENQSIEWWIQFFAKQNIKKVIPKELFSLIHKSIAAKIDSHFMNNSLDYALKYLQDYKATGFGRVEFSKVLKELKLRLNHEDIAYLFNSLGHNGIIAKNTFASFLVRPNSCPQPKEACAITQESRDCEVMGSEWRDKENWEMKAKTLYVKYSTANNNLEALEKENRDLQNKLKEICNEPKQLKVLDLQRKIEWLEGVIKERDLYIRKTLGGTNDYQVEMIRKNAEAEKAELLKVIEGKNKEILEFKMELDAVLSVMEKLKMKKLRTYS